MMGIEVPIVGDFHYNGHQLLAAEPPARRRWRSTASTPATSASGASATRSSLRSSSSRIRYDKPVRIGVNWGSLDQALAQQLMDENHERAEPWDAGRVLREALVRSAIDSAQRPWSSACPRIASSCRQGQRRAGTDRGLPRPRRALRYPLHLGLTEAGMGSKGIVASTAALAVLLQEGIGDTIRISLTPEPGASRTQEVIVAQELLQTMGLRAFTPLVTACPAAAAPPRSSSRSWPRPVQEHVRERMPHWKVSNPGAEHLTLAVMGCVVNGPGESRHANIGISLPGTGRGAQRPRVHRRREGDDAARREHRGRVRRHHRRLRGQELCPGRT
jgi:(E)-4-hydroxy-3-methylbut-2-enyl-diphosphate synthase